MLLIYPMDPRLFTTLFNVNVLTYPEVPRPITVLKNEIGVFKLLIYPEVPRPATVLVKLAVLTYPRVPKAFILLFVDAVCLLSKDDREERFTKPSDDKEAAIVLIVLGDPCRVLSLASSVAVLTYPKSPRPAVKIAAVLESRIAPKLQIAAKYDVDMVDNQFVVVYENDEKELMVEGRFPMTFPPTITSVDSIGVQVVPPMEFVRRTFPGSMVSPVFESTA